MSKLLEKLSKNSTSKESSVLTDSKFFGKKDEFRTELPILNLAASGSFKGGFKSGLTVLAGPSKHFKSLLGLYAVKSYMEKYSDAVCLYYDSEFGAPPSYLQTQGIDVNRVFHTPVLHIEQLKFDLVRMLDTIEKKDHVIIFIDSIGNLASKKEVSDAIDQKSVADMSRAKALKSLFRITTPHYTMKDIPAIAVNHTYQSIGMYPTTVVSGGTGPIYSADQIFVIGRSQEKDGADLKGYKFTINIEKSRYVKEKSKFSFIADFEKGINKWSGLFDVGLETGHITSPKKGYYTRTDIEGDKNWRKAQTNCKEFWYPLFKETDFEKDAQRLYALAETPLFSGDNDENDEEA